MGNSRIIQTKRIQMVPFGEEFLHDRYVNWLNDPEVVQFSEQRFRQHTKTTCREYMESFKGTPNYLWAIVIIDEDKGHIGNISAAVDPNNKIADISILIGEKMVWRKGYGSEAFVGVINYLFREVGIRKVTAGTMAVNKAMLKLMERAGMKEDGIRSRHFLYNDREVDLIHACLFKEDWEKIGR